MNITSKNSNEETIYINRLVRSGYSTNYTACHKNSSAQNYKGYFSMRIFKNFPIQILEVNTTFCSENTKFYVFKKVALFCIKKHENCIKI